MNWIPLDIILCAFLVMLCQVHPRPHGRCWPRQCSNICYDVPTSWSSKLQCDFIRWFPISTLPSKAETPRTLFQTPDCRAASESAKFAVSFYSIGVPMLNLPLFIFPIVLPLSSAVTWHHCHHWLGSMYSFLSCLKYQNFWASESDCPILNFNEFPQAGTSLRIIPAASIPGHRAIGGTCSLTPPCYFFQSKNILGETNFRKEQKQEGCPLTFPCFSPLKQVVRASFDRFPSYIQRKRPSLAQKT